jgi:NAD(P)-dependent dehydrogenase (short-subunit alcohol dehydrogenase family)
VVAVSAWAHSRSPIVFDDLQFERRDYTPWKGYGQSKTANILFALALDERARVHGVRAFSLHPGSIVNTGLSKYLSPDLLRAAGLLDKDGNPIIDPAKNLKTVEQGAATSVWCATSPQLDGMGGVYCHNSDIAPRVSDKIAANQFGSMALGVMPHAVDPQAADRLWHVSEELLGLAPFKRV